MVNEMLNNDRKNEEYKIAISLDSKNFYKKFLQQQDDTNEFLKEIKEIRNKDTSHWFYRYDLAIVAAMAYQIINDKYDSCGGGLSSSEEQLAEQIKRRNALLAAKNLIDEDDLNRIANTFCKSSFDLIHKFVVEIIRERIEKGF